MSGSPPADARATRPHGPGPLASTPFRWLLAARTTAIVGNAVAPIALAFAVLDLTGSAADLGLVVAARSIANVAVLLFGGVIADRLPRNVLLVGTSLAAAATQGTIAALVLTGTAGIPALVVLGVVNGAVAAVSLPAAAALVPDTVPAAQLRPANALLRLGLNAGSIEGASAGAGVIALIGPGWGLAIDAAAFAVAALLYARLRLPAVPAAAERTSVLSDLREGWREFSRRRWIWIVVLQFAVLNAAFTGATVVLGPLVADESLGRGAWGLVVAAQTAGFALGAVIALRWRPRRALGIGVAGMAVAALPVAALAAAPALAVLVGAFALGGLAMEVFAIAWDQSLQSHVPARHCRASTPTTWWGPSSRCRSVRSRSAPSLTPSARPPCCWAARQSSWWPPRAPPRREACGASGRCNARRRARQRPRPNPSQV